MFFIKTENMIEAEVIEWLDFRESIPILDTYSNKRKLFFFKFFRTLLKNGNFPIIINIILFLLYFIQIWLLSIFFYSAKDEKIYLKD